MTESEINRRDMLRKVGVAGALVAGIAGGSATLEGGHRRLDDDDDRGGGGLVGMWDVTVHGTTTYLYTYSFARDSFVAVGNIDANWDGQGSSFGATMGTHTRAGKHAYDIREKGWAFDAQGGPAGWFIFEGTYTLDANALSLTGGGTWTLYDLTGAAVYVEPLTVNGQRLS